MCLLTVWTPPSSLSLSSCRPHYQTQPCSSFPPPSFYFSLHIQTLYMYVCLSIAPPPPTSSKRGFAKVEMVLDAFYYAHPLCLHTQRQYQNQTLTHTHAQRYVCLQSGVCARREEGSGEGREAVVGREGEQIGVGFALWRHSL